MFNKYAIEEEKFFFDEPMTTERFINNTWYSAWTGQNETSTYKLPFIPGSNNLDTISLSLNATHPSNGLNQIDVHSLFGHLEGKVTREFFNNITGLPDKLKDKRPFIASRSTFSGSGQYVAHDLGQNQRSWADMAYGIAGTMNMNMFGIPMSGPNACGYFGAAREDEMCGRWIQLSSMLPLARQHRAAGSEGGPANEPYELDMPYSAWAKEALISRLQYVRHIYTCLFEASQEGGSCVDPLFMHFPDDLYTFDPSQTENSFILGNALKVVPVVEAAVKGVDQMVRTYFPKGEWVDMRDWSIHGNLLNGMWQEVPAPTYATDTIITYLRPGYLVPFQPQNKTHPFMTTRDLLNDAELHLVANPTPNGWAQGRIFIDEGKDSVQEIEEGDYEYYQFHVSAGSLKKWVLNDKAHNQQKGRGLDSLTIVNAAAHAKTNFACWISNDDVVSAVNYKYVNATQSLTLEDPNGPIDLWKLRNIYYGNNETDQNLCYGIKGHEQQYYKVKGDTSQPDLEVPGQIVIPLENNSPAHPDLNLTITVTTASMVNIAWNYADKPETVKTPYEIPSKIVDIDLEPGTELINKYVSWHTLVGANKGEFII